MTEKKLPHDIPTAYEDIDFIKSHDGRGIRIFSEFLEPQSRLERLKISDTIVFFGSARLLSRENAEKQLKKAIENQQGIQQAENDLKMSQYYEDAKELAKKITLWSKNMEKNRARFVVCTGGGPGIMEAANKGASEAKGLNIGFNISLPFEQGSNPWITSSLLFKFHYFFMRKFWFSYLAKAAVFFPGGFGTFDELFEILTLIQTKKMHKKLPIVLLGTEFWKEAVNFKYLLSNNLISPEDLELMLITDSVDEAFNYLSQELTDYALKKPGNYL